MIRMLKEVSVRSAGVSEIILVVQLHPSVLDLEFPQAHCDFHYGVQSNITGQPDFSSKEKSRHG